MPLKFLSEEVQIKCYPEDIQSIKQTATEEGTYVIYPHVKAKTFKDLSAEEISNIRKLVVIDCTWHQTRTMIESLYPQKEDAISDSKIKFIKLDRDYRTTFWRYQQNGPSCLATIEAIYYAYRELSSIKERKRSSETDSLESILFFYLIQFYKIYDNKKTLNKKDIRNKYFVSKSEKVSTDNHTKR